jgi:hypothetical protein
MSGKNYGEIASICNVKKELVLYIGNKLKWNEKRMSYYSEISSTLLQKTVTVKAESANTIATMVSALNQYFGDKFINYLRTKDAKHIDGIDSKMLAQYYKSLEMLDKLVPSSPSVAATPAVNINVGSNAKIEQSPNGDVTVTTDDSAKEILSALAKYKKKLSEEDEG